MVPSQTQIRCCGRLTLTLLRFALQNLDDLNRVEDNIDEVNQLLNLKKHTQRETLKNEGKEERGEPLPITFNDIKAI